MIAPSGLTLKSADRFLAVDLASSFHSDSPFFETQTHPEPIQAQAESRYFLPTNGHPQPCRQSPGWAQE